MQRIVYMFLGAVVVITAIILLTTRSTPTSGQAEDVFLPLITNAGNGTIPAASASVPCPPKPNYAVHPDDQHYIDDWCNLPRSLTPYEGAPFIRHAPQVMKADEVQRLADAATARNEQAQRIVVAGIETAGSTIVIAGKKIDLPPNVYVDSVIASVSPGPGEEAPKTPIYVLRTVGESRQWATLIIDRDGYAKTYHDDAARVRQDFAPALTALGVDVEVWSLETDEVVR